MSDSESTTGHAPPPEPVHDSEGQTLAAWTACGGVIAASVVAGAGVIIGSIPLAVASVPVALVGLAAGGLIGRAQRAADDRSS